jgi:hypothetical protein
MRSSTRLLPVFRRGGGFIRDAFRFQSSGATSTHLLNCHPSSNPAMYIPNLPFNQSRRCFCSNKSCSGESIYSPDPLASSGISGNRDDTSPSGGLPSAAAPASAAFSDVPGVKGEGDKYAMVYTCTACDTRAVKTISKQAYHHGTVLIRCPGCEQLHLIADHLGQFEERGWTVEDFLAEQGDCVRRVASDDVLELTMQDIAGGGIGGVGGK